MCCRLPIFSCPPMYSSCYSFFPNRSCCWNSCPGFETSFGIGLGFAAGYGIMRFLDKYI